ncbi:GNAT family N-acetyltransferase [Modicisalibacter coralii]|uniref:GNAT family N-acetyltransferase n=1 Tax=Modicisalibacter coralii TaxID=2304602 RepID=UPI00100C168C|nr:GNAT family protein [Halomonas coralii]
MTATNAFGQPVGPIVAEWRPPCVPGDTVLHGRTARVEPLDAARHAPALWRAWSRADPDRPGDTDGAARWTYLGGRPFADEAGCHDWLEHQSTQRDPRFLAVVDIATGEALGTLAWLNIVPEHGSIEIGHVSFSSRLSRTTLASEAFYLLMREAFALGYRRLEWKCDALNAPSRRAAERLGLGFEGVFRQHRVVQGHNRDTAWYALLDGEWPTIERAFRKWLACDNFDAEGRQRRSLATFITAASATDRRP